MRNYFLSLFLLFSLQYSFSMVLGGALSVDYFNNPVKDSAPSPIQQRPIFFHNMDIGLFNLRSGIGFTEGYYEINSDGIPVFNDYYSGFYTLEFDIFTYPGIAFKLTDKWSLGLAAGGGVRLPLVVKEDSGIDSGEVSEASDWFYSDMHFLFWGAQIFTTVKLPLSSSTKFYGNIHYKDFLFRDDHWITGATAGLLWQF